VSWSDTTPFREVERTCVGEDRFIDSESGTHAQRAWLDVLLFYPDRLNPGFCHVAYVYADGATALEHSLLATTHPREVRDPAYTVNECRRFLRGYSWLTIVPQELSDRLGGADGLRRTKAFAEVRPLSAGGVWLLASTDYRDYDAGAVRRVFHALAPVLRPGLPQQQPRYSNSQSPHPIVFQGAASARAHL
jgi:hypothetical protein